MDDEHAPRTRERRPWSRLRHALGSLATAHPDVHELPRDEMTRGHCEPCEVCGEETAAGSVFFSDRRVVQHADGSTAFVCTLCDQQIAAAHHGQSLDDEQLRRLLDQGLGVGIFWGREL